jgi:hypothetical protein
MSESEDDENLGRFNFEDILIELQIISIPNLGLTQKANDLLLPYPLLCSLSRSKKRKKGVENLQKNNVC